LVADPPYSGSCGYGGYYEGTEIMLTAAPAPGWGVGSWEGGTVNDDSIATTNTVFMPASEGTTTVTVHYAQLGLGTPSYTEVNCGPATFCHDFMTNQVINCRDPANPVYQLPKDAMQIRRLGTGAFEAVNNWSNQTCLRVGESTWYFYYYNGSWYAVQY
jgi:hypothetical protein